MESRTAIAALCTLLVSGCAGTAIRAGSPGTTSTDTMKVAGVMRTFLVHVPAHYDNTRRVPLVIVLHGHGESAGNFENYTGMSDKADTEGFVAVYPQALGDPAVWHTAIDGPATRDDIQFVRNIIRDVERRFRIDRRRIYVAGHSNGGIMAYRLASVMSDRIAAVGVTAGTIGMIDAHGDTVRISPPPHPVSVIHFHGVADPSVPYNGGPESDGPENVISTRNTIAFWTTADRCTHAPARTISADRNVIVDSWSDCADGTAVTLYTIVDGTHRWPGDDVPWYTFPGRDDANVNATDVMWAFFAAHPRER